MQVSFDACLHSYNTPRVYYTVSRGVSGGGGGGLRVLEHPLQPQAPTTSQPEAAGSQAFSSKHHGF